MLPVNEPGALLFMGDGHAIMGEGEVAGTGLETSMDVEFTVDLVKKKAIGWPRMETSFGGWSSNGRDADKALPSPGWIELPYALETIHVGRGSP